MKPVALRFVTTAVLFAGWIGYLVYLVTTLPPLPKSLDELPVILSRPQFLVSDVDVVGVVDDKDRTFRLLELLSPKTAAEPNGGAGDAARLAVGPVLTQPILTVRGVTIKEVLYPHDSALKPGYVLGVRFAEPGQPTPFDEPLASLPANASTLGPCLFALRPNPDGLTWDVTPLPPSPGFPLSPPRVYPANAETLAQYRQISKP